MKKKSAMNFILRLLLCRKVEVKFVLLNNGQTLLGRAILQNKSLHNLEEISKQVVLHLTITYFHKNIPHQYCNMRFHEKNQHRLRLLPLQHCHHHRRHHRHPHRRPHQGLLL